MKMTRAICPWSTYSVFSPAEDLKAAMQHGTVEGMSVGFPLGLMITPLARQGSSSKTSLTCGKLASVLFPANELAGVTAMKSIDSIKSIRDAEAG